MWDASSGDKTSLPNIVRVVKSRRMRWAGHVACIGEGRGVHRVLVGRPEGKRPLGRPRRRWEDNIEINLQEVGGVWGDWMELAQDRDRWRALVSTVMNLRVPKMRGISWLSAELVSFSRRTLIQLAAYRQATRNSYREWQYHMLHVYNYVLLKMSTWCSKHVEESSILWINNNQCIKLVINVQSIHDARSEKH